MAKDIIIRGVTYGDTPSIEVPLASGSGTAEFYDNSEATISNGNQMLSGVKAVGSDGTVYTGTIPNRNSSDLTASGDTVSVPAGNYASAASKSVESGSVTAPSTISGTSANVVAGTNTLTLSKTVSVTPNVSKAGYINNGTAGDTSVSLTANVTTKAADTIMPGTSDQTIDAATYLTGVQTIKGDSNLKSSNIVDGVSIFNVNGSAKIPVISQDPTTKVLSIS
jgi:hypothetical protein